MRLNSVLLPYRSYIHFLQSQEAGCREDTVVDTTRPGDTDEIDIVVSSKVNHTKMSITAIHDNPPDTVILVGYRFPG